MPKEIGDFFDKWWPYNEGAIAFDAHLCDNGSITLTIKLDYDFELDGRRYEGGREIKINCTERK